MASLKGTLIYPQRYINLKAAVKAECARRKYTGSVASYAGTQYDYTEIPTSQHIIPKEHFVKNNIPLKAINSNGMPSSYEERVITDDDMLLLETKVAAFATRKIIDKSPTDCAASCTGTCTTSCQTGCTSGCSGGCDGCSGCGGACSNSCSGGCSGCGGECSSSCTTGCGTGCSSECVSSCYGGCSGGDCGSSCGNCGTNCSGVCGAACAATVSS